MSDQAEALRALVRRRAGAADAPGSDAGLALSESSPPEVGDGSPAVWFWKKSRLPQSRFRFRFRFGSGAFTGLLGRLGSEHAVD